MKRAALLLAAASLLAARAEAGPWATGRGRVYVKVSYDFLRSTELAQPDGSVLPIPRFVHEEGALYVAYGVSERLTLIGFAPAWRSSDLQDFGRESGFGDLRFGAQWQLTRKGPWQIALRALVQAPTGDETRAEGLLPTGTGVWEGEDVLSAGRSFAGGRGYGFAEAGYQWRGGGLRDGVVYGIQVGWNATPRLVIAGNLRGVEPFSHAPRAEAFGAPVGFGDRVTYASYGPSAIFKLTRWIAAQLDVEDAFRTRNLATGAKLRVGIAFTK